MVLHVMAIGRWTFIGAFIRWQSVSSFYHQSLATRQSLLAAHWSQIYLDDVRGIFRHEKIVLLLNGCGAEDTIW